MFSVFVSIRAQGVGKRNHRIALSQSPHHKYPESERERPTANPGLSHNREKSQRTCRSIPQIQSSRGGPTQIMADHHESGSQRMNRKNFLFDPERGGEEPDLLCARQFMSSFFGVGGRGGGARKREFWLDHVQSVAGRGSRNDDGRGRGKREKWGGGGKS